MFHSNRKFKKYAVAILLLVLLVVGVSQLRIQSVRQYREEQERLAEEIIIADTNTGAAVLAEEGNTENPAGIHDKNKPPVSSVSSENSQAGTAMAVKPTEKTTVSKKNGQKKAEKNSKTSDKGGKRTASSGKSVSTSKQPGHASGEQTDGNGSQQADNNRENPKKTPDTKPHTIPKPSPVPAEEDKNFACTITIRCDNMLQHMDEVEPGIKEYIPEDGMILEQTEVKAEAGETAYSLLQKVCQAKGIALDASYTNAYSSAYVRGIGNIYEKQAGISSGWLYLVNGKLPGYGASRYKLKEGDRIEWIYSCTGKLE